MKEILTKLFGDQVTEDALTQFNAELGKKFVAKADYNTKLEDIKKLKSDKENLEGKIQSLEESAEGSEDFKKKYEELKNEIEEKNKQDEANRLAKEKADGIANRFAAVLGDKKFSHEAIKADYLRKFGEALDSKDYQGKSDKEILAELTKDDGAAFEGVNVFKLEGGADNGAGGDIDDAKIRAAMGLPPEK